MIPTLSWVARASTWARSRREIHRYASAVMYARRGEAAATSGPVGGGVQVSSDWSDWRDWAAEDETDLDELVDLALRIFQRAQVRRNSEIVDILAPLVAALHHRSEPSLPNRFSSS